MSLYDASVVPMKRMLGNASRWLDRAAEHAKERASSRTSSWARGWRPDQYPFARQICAACGAAKLAWPALPDVARYLERVHVVRCQLP